MPAGTDLRELCRSVETPLIARVVATSGAKPNAFSMTFVVVGYETTDGGLGSIRLAEERDGVLYPAGGVGTGFTVASAREMKRQLDRLVISKPPIGGLKDKGVVWTKPEMRVEVKYRGRTLDGNLRHPSFKGVREG